MPYTIPPFLFCDFLQNLHTTPYYLALPTVAYNICYQYDNSLRLKKQPQLTFYIKIMLG